MVSRRLPKPSQVNLGRHLINNQISPMVNLNYEAQLAKKQSIAQSVLSIVGRKVSKLGSSIKVDSHGLPCPLEEIRKSPIITGYRNKDEFSIWPGRDGKTPIVGFLSNSLSQSTTYCMEPDLTVTTKESHKILAKKFQNYIQGITKLGICTHFDKLDGNWRRFIVRSNQENDLMAMCILHPKVLTPNELNDEKLKLKEFFSSISSELSLNSLYFQACPAQRCTPDRAPFQLLLGDRTIRETILGHSFEIAPDSFFQVNTGGTDVLYQSMIEKLDLDRNTIVIDLNCEIGTAIIPIASRVKKIYGIDPSIDSVGRCYQNAQANGISNCQFFQGSILDLLPDLFKKLESEQSVIVITKPKRGGLTNAILSHLREFEPIKQVVYLSSKPNTMDAISNFVHLCKPFRPGDGILGGHFNPAAAIPVDLFPQTNHLELIVIFERKELILFQ